MRHTHRHWVALLALVAAVALVGCGGGGSSNTSRVALTVSLRSARSSRALISDIAKIRITISGYYMTEISDEFTITAGQTVTRSYVVPQGMDRSFQVDALNVQDQTIFSGKTVQEIVAGANTVKVDLLPTS